MLGTLLVALLVAGQPQHSAPRPALLEVASMVRSSQLLILGEAASDTVGLSAVAGAVTGLDEVEAKTHVAQHTLQRSACQPAAPACAPHRPGWRHSAPASQNDLTAAAPSSSSWTLGTGAGWCAEHGQ